MKVNKLSESFYFSDCVTVNLSESTLTEAPAVLDRARRAEGSNTDEGEQNRSDKHQQKLQKKFNALLARDLSSKNARSTFYIDHNYRDGMSQNEWKVWVNKISELEQDPENATRVERLKNQRANAIVVDSAGFYMRRGLENLENKYIRFIPGKGDELSSGFHTDSYSYKECVQRVESKDYKQFIAKLPDLCRLTGIEIIGANGDPLTMDAIRNITPEDFSNLSVRCGDHPQVEMSRWVKDVKRSKLL